MMIRELSKDQVSWLFEVSLLMDFPDNERKPLPVILKGMDEGYYHCFGLLDGDKICGYGFFVSWGDNYLLDYLAVLEPCRNQGLGGSFLRAMNERFQHAAHLLIEVEDYRLAKDPEERKLQERRYHFYLRNGCQDTGLTARVFGADFILLQAPGAAKASGQELMEIYLSLYQQILPPDLYRIMLDL